MRIRGLSTRPARTWWGITVLHVMFWSFIPRAGDSWLAVCIVCLMVIGAEVSYSRTRSCGRVLCLNGGRTSFPRQLDLRTRLPYNERRFLIVCLQVVAGPNIVNLGEEGASDMDSRESVESENMKSVVQVALTSSLNMPLRRALIRLRLAGHCVRVLHALAPRAC